ncbi:MAG: methyltransferase domain-containing protein [bacterium]|nr:methyltransferase domain-containing protein [bacterium]
MEFSFNKIANSYAKYREIHPGVLRNLLTRIDKDQKVLEIGCGTGNYIIALNSLKGCQAWGIDISEEMLSIAQNRTSNVDFRVQDAINIDFPSEFFDFIFSVNVIHHIKDYQKYYREAYRVLKYGGVIVTITDSEWILRNRKPLTFYFPETLEVDLKRYPSIEKLKNIMKEIGFQNIGEEITEYYYYLTDIGAYREKSFSSLNLISEEAFRKGIERMERDLERGPIPCVSRFIILWGEKTKKEE